MRRKSWSWRTLLTAAALGVLAMSGTAGAKSSYMTTFRAAYPAAAGSRIDSCLVCHTTTTASPSTRNVYGTAFAGANHSYTAINAADSDADGFSNQTEITQFFFPGNAADRPAVATPPTVTIAATDATATEAGATTGQYTLTRTGATTAALTVNYAVGGTATAGSDYAALSGSVQIPVGAATATVTVTPINDATVEADETVVATLGANAAYTVGAASSATVTIQSDDVALPTVTIAATDATATEAGATTGQYTLTRTGATTSALTVGYTTGGTATAGSDYVALSGSVQIPAGAATATVTVTPIDDVAVEANESVVVTLGANAAYTVGAAASATVTIQSDEAATLPVVTIAATDATATEAGATTGSYTVTRTGATTAALAVNYTAGGTATAGSDYTALSGSVQIPAGAATATVTVTPVNDTAAETSETVVVTLGAGSGYNVGTASSATVTIQSDDVAAVATVTIAATDPTATEAGTTTGQYTLTRAGATTAALTVNYTVGGTAAAGSDYAALSGSVQIPAGASTATLTVTPLNDATVETAETVVVTLAANAAYTVGAAAAATVTIQSDDVVVEATLTVASTNPSNGIAITVSPSDISGAADGTTQFTRTYIQGAQVTLTALPTYGGAGFGGWSGCTSASGVTCYVTMDASKIVTASYAASTAAVLWTRADTGQAAVWKVAPGVGSGGPIRIASGKYLLSSAGVGRPWEATGYQQVSNTEAYVLWSRSDTGQAALWKVDPSARPDTIPVTRGAYLHSPSGVGAPWQATGYQHVSSTEGYVLWSRSDTGQAALWKINPSLMTGTIPITSAAYLHSPAGVGGPWQATSYRHVSATEGYVLWTRGDTGQAALWQIDPSSGGGVIPITRNAYSSPKVGGPWEATGYQHVSATEGYLLWTRSDTGQAALWQIDPSAEASFGGTSALSAAYLHSPSGIGGPWQATGYSFSGVNAADTVQQ